MIELTGKIVFDKTWYLLQIEDTNDLTKLHELLNVKYGQEYTFANNLHISIIKNEAPTLKPNKFGKSFVNEKITIQINDETLHDVNGLHVWFEIENTRLCEMREFFDLPCVKINDKFKVKFHMTIAKLINKKESVRENSKIIRISRATHIELHDMHQRL
jgi:hypothetical protein